MASWNWHVFIAICFIFVFVFTTILAGELQSPQFLSQPSNITANLIAVLPCTAAGDPTPTIRWFRGGSLLDVGIDSRLNQTAVGLEVQELQEVGGEELEGIYHCEANNSVGSVWSTPASLTRSGAVRNIPYFPECRLHQSVGCTPCSDLNSM